MFLKRKKNPLALESEALSKSPETGVGRGGTPLSLCDAPRRAPALRPEHAHTPPSSVPRPSGANPKLARPRQVSRPVRLRPKAASKSRPAPSPRPQRRNPLYRAPLAKSQCWLASPFFPTVPKTRPHEWMARPTPPTPHAPAPCLRDGRQPDAFRPRKEEFSIIQMRGSCRTCPRCPERSAFPLGAQRRRGSGHTTPTWSWGRVEGWHVRAPPCSAHRRGGPVLPPQGRQTHVPGASPGAGGQAARAPHGPPPAGTACVPT